MRHLKKICVLIASFIISYHSNAQSSINSFDEFVTLAKAKSLTIKNGEVQLTQAKKAKLAAILGIVEPSGNASFSFTNNTQLPVNLIPSEILGGTAGTFKEVKFGVQYNTTTNTYVELKLLNLAGWENYKLSKLNIQLTESNNTIALKSLFENSAIVYFNIVTLKAQLQLAKQQLESSESLYTITSSKYQSGLVNQQDLNECIINKQTCLEQIKQIEFLIKQQEIALKLLCDIPDEVAFVIDAKAADLSKKIEVENNKLVLNNAMLNYQTALSNYKKEKYSNAPGISLFTSFSNQQFNTKGKVVDKNVNWIPSSYIGLKLNIPLPTATSIAHVSKAKYDVQLAFNQQEKAKIQSTYSTSRLQIDYDKAVSQAESNKKIYQLRKDTYDKNLTNFKEGVISLDATLKSFNEMVNSNYNLIASEKMIELALTKISLNNTIQ